MTNALYECGFWSDVCFMAEQTAQTALKAFLFGQGRRVVFLHSIQELALRCAEIHVDFTDAVEWGETLDRYYILTRYPDALAPLAVPFKSYTESDASQARQYTSAMVALVRTGANG